MLADDGGRVGGAVEDLLHLTLDQSALFFHDHDGRETVGEVADRRGLQRPGAADLEKAEAVIGGPHFVEAEVGQRLQDVEVALAGGDDADPRLASAAQHQLVEGIRLEKSQHRRNLELVQAFFLSVRIVARPDVEPARRHAERRERRHHPPR